jgi:tetratricopeptide (TPR) repeat protein
MVSASPHAEAITQKKVESDEAAPPPDEKTAISTDEKPATGEEPAREKPKNELLAEAPPASLSMISSSDDAALSLDTRIDTAIDRPRKVNLDPLASYKTDSDFITTTIPIRNIPVVEYKNKPKYLIPVDSATRMKGEFYLIQAREELAKGDFQSGDKSLRRSIELDPHDAQAWMLHADLFLTMGLAEQALKEYIISGEIDPTNPKVFYNIALLYAKANDHQRAYKNFTRAIEVDSRYLPAYLGRATLQIDEREYEGAVDDYDRALAIDQYYTPALKARALARMELRKFTDAISDFDLYLQIEDPDGYVLYQRGISRIYSNDTQQGCVDLSSALELGFKDAEKAIRKFCQ